MADIRVTQSGVGGKFPSRVKGTRAAFQLNTFGMTKLHEGITGEVLAEIAFEAIQPAYEQALVDWPKITHASVESIEVTTTEIGDKVGRVALQIGGEKLINDPRNKKHIDYAPYVEYNGTAKTPPGTLTHCMVMHEQEMKRFIHASVKHLIQELLA